MLLARARAPQSSRAAEAEDINRQVLAIWTDILGASHPDTALAMSNLALAITEQGRHAEAERLHRRSLEILRDALGPDHPDMALRLNNLAAAIEAQGRYAEAEGLSRQALGIMRETLGPGHPTLALLLNGLAWMQIRLERPDDAAALVGESAAIFFGAWCAAGFDGESGQDGRRHPWALDNEGCRGHPEFTMTTAYHAAFRLAYRHRPEAAVRTFSHAGDMVLGRTLKRYGLFMDARAEFRRFVGVHQDFVSAAWAAAYPQDTPEIGDNLRARHWPARESERPISPE